MLSGEHIRRVFSLYRGTTGQPLIVLGGRVSNSVRRSVARAGYFARPRDFQSISACRRGRRNSGGV